MIGDLPPPPPHTSWDIQKKEAKKAEGLNQLFWYLCIVHALSCSTAERVVMGVFRQLAMTGNREKQKQNKDLQWEITNFMLA